MLLQVAAANLLLPNPHSIAVIAEGQLACSQAADTQQSRLVSYLVHIWAEAIGVAVAKHIRVVIGAGHVHLARKSLS